MKKTQILTAAMQLFIEEGFGKVSMELVSRQAQVSKATLYAHFASKNQLFSEALHFYHQQNQIVQPRLPTAIPQSLAAFNHELKVYLKDTFEFYNHDAVVQLYRLLISEIKQFPHLFELFFGNASGNMTSSLAAYLERYALSLQLKRKCFILACQVLDLVRGATLWIKLVQNQQKQQLFADKEQLLEQICQSSLILVNNFFNG